MSDWRDDQWHRDYEEALAELGASVLTLTTLTRALGYNLAPYQRQILERKLRAQQIRKLISDTDPDAR